MPYAVKQRECIYSFGTNPVEVLDKAREWVGRSTNIVAEDNVTSDDVCLVYITPELHKELSKAKEDLNSVKFTRLRYNCYGAFGQKVKLEE